MPNAPSASPRIWPLCRARARPYSRHWQANRRIRRPSRVSAF
jgi:hypothetical protein